jgi:hypothetical protein
MSAAAGAGKKVSAKKGPEVRLVEEKNKAALKKAYNEAEETFKIVKAAKSSDKPYIVWLYGPPGSGKSSPATLHALTDRLGLNIDDAARISLDALIEGLEPFQRKSAAAYVPPNATNAEKEKARKIAQSLYTQAMQAKVEEKTLNDRRKELFKKAVEYDLDILYEFVVSDPSKDYFKNEIYDVLEAAGKLDTYDIYVVYPFVPPEILKTRLEERPARQMASPTPFFRYVSPEAVKFFVNSHYDYFLDYILPRTEKKNLIGEIPLIGAYISGKLKQGITEEEIRSKLTEQKDLPGRINKVVIFENKSSNSNSKKNYTQKIREMFEKTNGGKRSSKRKTLKKSSK